MLLGREGLAIPDLEFAIAAREARGCGRLARRFGSVDCEAWRV